MSYNPPEFLHPIGDVARRLVSITLGKHYPIHRNEPVRPVFIVGAPRSGNTLLRRIFQANPDIHIPPETYVLARAISAFRRNRDRSWDVLLRLVLGLFEFHPEFDRFELPLRPLFSRLLSAPTETRSLALILNSFYLYHAESIGKSCNRWGDKTPLNAYCLPKINAVFPRAQYVHILRDGVDSVYSMLVKTQFEWGLTKAATRWKTSVEAIRNFARRKPELCCELRYEDLVSNPRDETERLCRFFDLAYCDSMVESVTHGERMHDLSRYAHHANVLKPITNESIGKGRRELSREQRLQLQKLIGDYLERWGYEPCAGR